MNKNYQIFSESQPPKSEKAPRQRLTDNSRRIKEYSSSFDLSNPEDFRRFNVDPVTYVEQIKPNDLLSLRSLIHNLAQNITTPSQRQIGSANGFSRQSVSTHFGGLEAADVMGSHYNFKQNSSYCLNGIFYDKKIAFKLRFLLPELYLYVCFTLYNSKEYYTPLYVPNDSPDFDLFDQYPRNLNSCIPLFNVSVKKDRVSPHNYNLIRGGIYEEGDQKGEIVNNVFSEQVKNSMDDCVCTEGFNDDPYDDYSNRMIQRAHQTTAKALQDKEINYNDDEILEFYEKQLVRLRDAEKEKKLHANPPSKARGNAENSTFTAQSGTNAQQCSYKRPKTGPYSLPGCADKKRQDLKMLNMTAYKQSRLQEYELSISEILDNWLDKHRKALQNPATMYFYQASFAKNVAMTSVMKAIQHQASYDIAEETKILVRLINSQQVPPAVSCGKLISEDEYFSTFVSRLQLLEERCNG